MCLFKQSSNRILVERKTAKACVPIVKRFPSEFGNLTYGLGSRSVNPAINKLTRFVQQFGLELGKLWFNQDLDYVAAAEKFIDHLAKIQAELKEKQKALEALLALNP